MNDWNAVTQTHKDMFTVIRDDTDSASPPQQHMVFMRFSRCSYEFGRYEAAIGTGEAAVETNQHFPGVHKKYVALSYKANGDMATARMIMNRAVLYETPWEN